MRIAIIVIACLVAASVVGFFVWRIVRQRLIIRKMEIESGERKERQTFKQWLIAHKPSKRKLIQIYAALLYNANIKGFINGEIYKSETTKYTCVPGLNCYSCPGAVGACPLGAFQNSLAESNVRAPYYVLGILGIFGLMLARTICGFLCPVGLGQELLYKIRTPKLKKSRVTRVLSYFKYVLLIGLAIIIPLAYAMRNVPLPGFCKYICPAGTLGGAIGLLIHPDNAEMFSMLGGQFAWKFSLLVVFIVASIFIFRFFCRFFCPLGAIYGFFNKIALIGVKVEKDDCTDCGKCVAACKMDIKRVGDHECINCGECIPVCPTKAISWKGSSIFLHKSAIDDTPTIKAIDLSGGVAALKVPLAEQFDDPVERSKTADDTVKPLEIKAETVAQTEENNLSDDNEKPAQGKFAAVKRKFKDKKFIAQLITVITALAILIGALVYYNFIDVTPKITPPPQTDDTDDEDIGYSVGQTAPDFTIALYGSDASFNLHEQRGKLTVVNFWATWCTPCVNEIHYFDELARNYTDINVIAIHGSSTQDVNKFIANKWPEHTLTFGQDNLDGTVCLTYKMLGGTGMWPMTVIVDEEGKVLYNSTKSFHSYEELEQLILSLTVTIE